MIRSTWLVGAAAALGARPDGGILPKPRPRPARRNRLSKAGRRRELGCAGCFTGAGAAIGTSVMAYYGAPYPIGATTLGLATLLRLRPELAASTTARLAIAIGAMVVRRHGAQAKRSSVGAWQELARARNDLARVHDALGIERPLDGAHHGELGRLLCSARARPAASGRCRARR